jgi:hypothetical protein
MNVAETTAEKHYTVQEISRDWALSAWMIRKLFEDEPDVLTIGHRLASRKRKYVTIRIPHHVKERVRRRLAVRAA